MLSGEFTWPLVFYHHNHNFPQHHPMVFFFLCLLPCLSIFLLFLSNKLVSKVGLFNGKHLFVRVTSKAATSESHTFDKPVLLIMMEWPLNTQSPSEKCWQFTQRFKHSVEVKFLASHTIWVGTSAKGQTKNNVVVWFFFSVVQLLSQVQNTLGQSLSSCSPDNVHSTIPEEAIVDPALLRSEEQESYRAAWRSAAKAPSICLQLRRFKDTVWNRKHSVSVKA